MYHSLNPAVKTSIYDRFGGSKTKRLQKFHSLPCAQWGDVVTKAWFPCGRGPVASVFVIESKSKW